MATEHRLGVDEYNHEHYMLMPCINLPHCYSYPSLPTLVAVQWAGALQVRAHASTCANYCFLGWLRVACTQNVRGTNY